MPFSATYKITPMSVLMFKHSFDVQLDDEAVVYAYKTYLNTNAENHHYNGITIDEWYKREIQLFKKSCEESNDV